MTPPQGGCDAATGDLNTTELTVQIEQLSPSQEREIVKDFYDKIGESRLSRQKINEGAKVITDLKGQGFSADDITAGISWILSHTDRFGGQVYSLALLPLVIGQALRERGKEKKATERKQQLAREEQRLEAEQVRRQELEALYRSLPPTEQAALREVAVENLLQSGVEKRFLLEPLVRGEICRLLRERKQQPPTPTPGNGIELHLGRSRAEEIYCFSNEGMTGSAC